MTKSHLQIFMAKMSEFIKFACVNRNLCRIHFTKFQNIGVENVTSLYWFAGIYERCLHVQICLLEYVITIHVNTTAKKIH